MKPAATRQTGGAVRVAFAAALLALGSCTADTGPELNASPGFAAPSGLVSDTPADVNAGTLASAATDVSGSTAPGGNAEDAVPTTAPLAVKEKTATEALASDLPQQVAFVPAAKPAETAASDAIASAVKKPETAVSETGATESSAKGVAEAAEGAQAVRKHGFLSLFSSQKPAQPRQAIAYAAPQDRPVKPAATSRSAAKPLIDLQPSAAESKPAVIKASFGDALPGVRKTESLFEISRKSGLDDDSDIDLHEDEAPAIQVASAGGMARLGPGGLLVQRESVDVACLKPGLVQILKTVEQHFGRRLIVTSGYRSPAYNRKVRGARHSQHMFCAAADVQMPGVSKWELASFVRSMPGRGGVGTYCHTDSIHIDVGPERDWNWRCSRRKS